MQNNSEIYCFCVTPSLVRMRDMELMIIIQTTLVCTTHAFPNIMQYIFIKSPLFFFFFRFKFSCQLLSRFFVFICSSFTQTILYIHTFASSFTYPTFFWSSFLLLLVFCFLVQKIDAT